MFSMSEELLRKSVKVLLLALIVVGTIDALSTYFLISNYDVVEVNPLMAALINEGFSSFFVVKGLLTLGPVMLIGLVLENKTAFVVAALLLGIYLSVIIHHINIWRAVL